MEEEVLFETLRHASRPHSPNYPPHQQKLREGEARGLRAYLPFRGGITQLKEKWNGYRKPRRTRRLVSLFVSAKGEYVAVSSRNQIIILQKDNDYQEPVGIFTCTNASIVTSGSWSESHALLGVADDTDTIYIIKPSGEEITRITKTHLNVSSSIVGLTMQCNNNTARSCLCTFCIFLSDGSVLDMEVSKDPSSVISSHSMKSRKILRHFPQDLCCWDYHPQLSLFASVTSSGDIQSTYNGSTGSCAISLWRTDDNSLVEPVVLTISGGSYAIEKGCQGQLACPKVLLSPLGNFVATLDMNGCLFAFKFDKEKHSLSKLSYGKSNSSDIFGMLSSGKEYLDDVLDFTWWSDCILSIAKRNRKITMVGVLNSISILENDFVYSMPLLDSARDSPGLIFLLENTSSEENYILSEQQKCSGLIEHVMAERSSQVEFSNLEWSLISLTKRSVLETYDKLISSQRYQDALTFADHHGLDKDEVLKSQWLSSGGGVEDIHSILRTIKDHHFVISECVDRIGPTEDAMRALITLGLRLTDSYRFSKSEEGEGGEIWNFRLARLKLLQFKDRVETFLGINMGRFSMQDYKRFRDVPIKEAALALAEDGKIGALNLLFKRHPCSLVPGMLDVLAAIPETIPVESYGQLLPAISAPSNILIRDEDWVECEKMVRFVEDFHGNLESIAQIMTDPMLSKHMAFQWPSVSELTSWYKKRTREIDSLSGQLDNCMCLVDFAIRKGISDLQKFLEDIFYLHQLIYSEDDEEDMNFSMTLAAWEQLPDYEKFKLMLMGVKEDNLITKLQRMAIPFMLKRVHKVNTDFVTQAETVDSFLVRWLKEIAAENKLDLCLMIFEVCNDTVNNQFFKDEVEVIDCALQCIYLCTDIDKWSIMCNILATLPRTRELEDKGINQRLRLAEGHIEAGRLMSYYQVPKPISFFLDADLDEKGVKQILRLLLSKFIRSHPSKIDNDWATMWRDMQTLQEKGFPFLELEYMFTEFCRGLLKAGKFSLARSYLKGTNSVPLATDKAENLVIQSAREYFFSAPTLSCAEIWRARECLNIFPNSRNVRAETDIIDAITDRLPNLGVNLLPMAFRQIKDPMEIVKLAITSQSGAYMHVDELVEIAKLLGLSSQEEISIVQEAIAREAAIAGHMQLAFDLCLVLAKKGHGSAWDLCATLARSQALDSMDLKSQKFLLGFALSHCDDESIGQLLNEWKDLDVQNHCENLIVSTGKDPSDFFEQASLNGFDLSGRFDAHFEDQDQLIAKAKTSLCQVAENVSSENGYDWESFLRENTKVASVAALQLPWLLELCDDLELGKTLTGSLPTNQHVSLRERAVMTTLLWLTRNSFAPKDNLIASLAKSIMEPPASDEEDYIGCSVLLNLADAFHGVEIIEQQLRERQNYHEFSSLMNVGMMYGLLHNCGVECNNPAERRELLQNKFQEKHKSVSSDPDEYNTVREAQSTFWNEWKAKLEQQKHVADKSRILEKVIPGVETSRFISGDREYIESVVFSQIESVKLEKKRMLKDTLNLANTYGLDRGKVLLYYLGTILVSEAWSVDDIMEEISVFKEELLTFAAESVQIISSSVYPAIGGHDKTRLAFIYNFLHECYVYLAQSKGLPVGVDQDLVQTRAIELARFCDVVGKECSRVSFIGGLNFKNIAGLEDLNSACFNNEVCAHIDENNVEALATMVKNLVLVQGVTVPQSLMSSESVYTYHILNSLVTLEGKAEKETYFQSSEDLYTFMNEIEQTYDICKKHMRFVEHPGFIDTVKRFFSVILLINKSLKTFPCDVTAKESVVKLINFWLRLIKEMEELQSLDGSLGCFYSECSLACLTVLSILLVKELLLPNRCWSTLVKYVGYGLECSAAVETYNFCRAMIFSGCGFKAMAHVFSEVVAHLPPETVLTATTEKFSVNIQDLPNLYLSILEAVLQEMVSGSVERQSIHYLVSSLSKLEGNLDDLKNVRLAVWDHLSKFSHNLQLPSHLRVYVLELMQFISGKKRNLDLFPSEGPVTHLLTWDRWEDSQARTTNREDESDDLAAVDSSSRFTNTLVALKSSQLVASISPDLEITPDDILSVETAVSCFLRLSESVTRMSHVDSLLAVLAEWEGLFMTGVDEENPAELSDIATNAWSNDDDWDEGWESFQEEPSKSIEKESNKTDTLLIHPLHTCWSTILKKLVKFAGYTQILKLIDQSASENYGTLLDEEDTYGLAQTALEVDCFLALKIALLFSYKEIQTQCLDAVEKKLKEVGISNNIDQDQFLFLLILSSGAVSSILTQARYGAIFSYLCFMVGNFCRVFQESTVRFSGDDKSKESLSILFPKLLFPCFISELVKADQHVLAGVLITRFMHTNASLSLINISEASLGIYLERQYQQQLQEIEDAPVTFSGPLLNTSTNLRAKLGDLIQSAISYMPNHVR